MNNFFFDCSNIFKDVSNLIGNKSYNTFLLQKKGFKVPKSIFLTVNLFNCYYNDTLKFNEIVSDIQSYLKIHGFTNSLAIRSSAILIDSNNNVIKEDSKSFSMAGWFKSCLNIKINDIKSAIINCYNVVNSNVLKQNIYHHFQKNVQIQIALLIQDFYEAEKSAVIFTKNPYNYNNGTFLINATYGACNGLVSGEITGDSYWLNRENFSILQKYISLKKTMYVNDFNNIKLISVTKNFQNNDVLSYDDLIELYNLGKSIESSFNYPQDIEIICNQNHEWIVVQTRPIHYWRIKNE